MQDILWGASEEMTITLAYPEGLTKATIFDRGGMLNTKLLILRRTCRAMFKNVMIWVSAPIL